MPLLLARSDRPSGANALPPIEIGLLNNLGDAGLERGDREIVDLLRESAGGQPIRLHFFSLPSIARGTAAQAYMAARYTDFSAFFATRLEGLFVTGCEPRQRTLPEEAFWPQLTEVMDWAEHNTRSTIWSCLAAHAAVLHFDGIERRPLDEKCSGLFSVERIAAHPLLDDAPCTLRVPHSRYNGLDPDALAAAGYEVLTRGPQIDVDVFVKAWRSLFVYFQGHPEYDADAIKREYHRDVTRFLSGTGSTYPTLPVDCFEPGLATRLLAFADEAQATRDAALLTRFPLARGTRSAASAAHREFAATLFRNWLHLLRATATHHAA